jgi:Ca2+-transporting ATPase
MRSDLMNDMHSRTIKQSAAELKTSLTLGLSTEEAEARLIRDGENSIAEQKKKSILLCFLSQFKDFMVIVLILAAIISFFTQLYNGGSYIDSIIILAIVLLNAIIGVIQESKAEKAIAALKQLSAPHCTVRRDGQYTDIETDKLVVGDIIRLSRGDIVPADCRLIEAHALSVSEANLTGESLPIDKNADTVLPSETPLSERSNMLYMGTCITTGRCEAIVSDVGMNSEMGHIANMLSTSDNIDTPLQQRLNHTGKLLGSSALFICFVIFVIGLMRHIPFFDMFMTAVSLSVAAIPEGLPAIVTIVLAIGVKRMAAQRAVVRRLPAVEALGSATVICTDKTGTITQNRMKVTELSEQNEELTLTLMAMCNDSELTEDGTISGEPTENGLAEAALSKGINKTELENFHPRIDEYPFDSTLKRMTTIHSFNGKFRCITKGAPEYLLPLCTHYLVNGKSTVITDKIRNRILARSSAMCSKALRVIAVAYKDSADIPSSREYAEYGLTFCGLAGLLDPPRAEIKNAVKQCRLAGIRPIMITGDNIATATAIAEQTGILQGNEAVISGNELDKIADEALCETVENCNVFARVTPTHKVRIVKALQSNGSIVAMTGDGINDAPALKIADIGCAMGIAGTDAAKEAADMVLTDDNFATIISAVHEGRNIYENIRKAIHFLLSSNIGEIITIFAAMVIGFDSPLLPIQLLWVNLVTDSLPAIALGVDPCDEDIMLRPPRKESSLFSNDLRITIALEGAMIGMLALTSFAIGKVVYDSIIVGRTMAFAVLSMSQLVHAFNMRSEHSLFDINLLGNKSLVGSLVIGVLMQVLVIQLPRISDIFSVTPLTCIQWLVVIFFCLMPIVLVELEKKFVTKN